ncbi:MAG: DUF1624 domain-containing protein [Acidobacteria bacterium]|nr:DUF1624 domain-containing protein [Acidobacteriota bacterium]
MSTIREAWGDRSPSKRCDFIDQLRGWAVIVMIEVHAVNVWLIQGMRPEWLNYLNGLMAPVFTMAAGFSLVVSTFRTDGTIRPFWPDTARRLGFILLCAYALHAPGLSLADWTVLSTPQKLRELFKFDVLQCIVFSLLVLQGLARIIRNARVFTWVALGLAIWIPLISPYLWAQGVGDGLWLPIRGWFNGNADRGVQALFPLFPWLAFPAFGSFMGGLYRWARVEADPEGRARFSEGAWLAAMFLVGIGLWAFGSSYKKVWLWQGTWIQGPDGAWRLLGPWGAWSWNELQSIHNTTLPSVLDRLGWILMGGGVVGWIEKLRPRWPGPNPVVAASQESLLVYMLHLNMIFGVMLTPAFLGLTGWDWGTQGWPGTLLLTAALIALNLWIAVLWQKVRKTPERMRFLQRAALSALAVWFVAGGWWTFRFYLQSPELAREPYAFLNSARQRKGLAPTPDGLCRDPEEYFRESERRKLPLSDQARAGIRAQIERRAAPAP